MKTLSADSSRINAATAECAAASTRQLSLFEKLSAI